jgi:hypothetical protein
MALLWLEGLEATPGGGCGSWFGGCADALGWPGWIAGNSSLWRRLGIPSPPKSTAQAISSPMRASPSGLASISRRSPTISTPGSTDRGTRHSSGQSLRRRRGNRADPGRHRRHLSHHPDAPGDRRPGSGERRGDDAGALLSRPWQRREPKRAHPRRWPETDIRQEMLVEAIEVIRLLWKGGLQSHHGKHYTVENARLYTLP